MYAPINNIYRRRSSGSLFTRRLSKPLKFGINRTRCLCSYLFIYRQSVCTHLKRRVALETSLIFQCIIYNTCQQKNIDKPLHHSCRVLYIGFRFRQCIVEVARSTFHPCIWRLAYFQTPRPIVVILHELFLDQAMIQFIRFFLFLLTPFTIKKAAGPFLSV